MFPSSSLLSQCYVSSSLWGSSREYWMIHRGPGFLVVEWFGTPPTTPPVLPWTRCLSFSVFLSVAGQAYWQEKGREAKLCEPRVSLVLYISFNTLWARSSSCSFFGPPPSPHPTQGSWLLIWIICPDRATCAWLPILPLSHQFIFSPVTSSLLHTKVGERILPQSSYTETALIVEWLF